KGGRLTRYAELDQQMINKLLEDRDGSVWVGSLSSPTGRLCAIRNGSVQCYGEDGRFGQGVLSLCEYRGSLLAGAQTGLWRWKPDSPKLYPVSVPGFAITDLIEGNNGALWIAIGGEIRQLTDGKVEAYQLPAGGTFNPRKFLRDREGGLWIGTRGQGLAHL